MKHAISIAILLVTFAAGLVVGAWKPDVIRALMVRWDYNTVVDNQGPYYHSRLAFFRQTVGDADVIMLGDSITEGIDWRELFPDIRILNRGISGDTGTGVLNWLDEVIKRRPKIVFLMIGSNNLQIGVPVSAINANIRSIVGALEQTNIRIILQRCSMRRRVIGRSSTIGSMSSIARCLICATRQEFRAGSQCDPWRWRSALKVVFSGWIAFEHGGLSCLEERDCSSFASLKFDVTKLLTQTRPRALLRPRPYSLERSGTRDDLVVIGAAEGCRKRKTDGHIRAITAYGDAPAAPGRPKASEIAAVRRFPHPITNVSTSIPSKSMLSIRVGYWGPLGHRVWRSSRVTW
jgi:hypothetical protein